MPVSLGGIGFFPGCHQYHQKEVLGHLNQIGLATDDRSRRFFDHPHIETRYLGLQFQGEGMKVETVGPLLRRHQSQAVAWSHAALEQSLSETHREIEFLVCVSSTGFSVPPLSALLGRTLRASPSLRRLDIVGMGCHGGLNALMSAVNWCEAHPGAIAAIVCAEIASCLYSTDPSENASLVNSLFGDGVVSCLVQSHAPDQRPSWALVRLEDFESEFAPEHIDALRIEFADNEDRFRFWLAKNTPDIIGNLVQAPLRRIFARNGIEREAIESWAVHTGGAAVLDSIAENLLLPCDKLKASREILRKYGNISSGSFLLVLRELHVNGAFRPDAPGMMLTMGPGVGIETAFFRWW